MSGGEPSSVTHVLYLRDGEVQANEPSPGFWVVSWYPHRSDHPDYPGSTIDSAHEPIPTDRGPDAVLEWARERFGIPDPRIVAEVSVEAGTSNEELEALQSLFDEAGAPAVVKGELEFRSAVDELVSWSMVIKAPLTAFLMAIMTRAGSDVWDALKGLVGRIYAERRRPDRVSGSIRFEDERRIVILTDRVPDDGYQQLASGELPETGYLLWDEATGSWRAY